MGADAAIFSITEVFVSNAALTPVELEQRFLAVLLRLGTAFAYKGIIPGHIKVVLAKADDDERFLFLSMTKTDRVDQKPSLAWAANGAADLTAVRLDINVLVFGYTKAFIAEIVDRELKREGLRPETTISIMS